jgi:WD40 repeat protein
MAALTLAGCSAPTTQETGPARNIKPRDLVAVEGPAPAGRFYVKAGENDLDSDLYEMLLSSSQFDRLTTKARVSTLDGCSERVVVAAAQKTVGFTDHLQELQGSELVPVETLGLEPGSDPHVSADCRILSTRLADDGDGAKEVRLWDPASRTSSTVATGNDIVSAAWGPDGQIVVLHRQPEGPKLVVKQPDGTQTEISPGVPDVGNVQWGQGGWMAMGLRQPQQPPTGTLFFNPANDERSTLDGWLPLTWSPDGQQLLVTDAKKGTTLAVVELPDLNKTRNVGVSEVGTVWDAVWLLPA